MIIEVLKNRYRVGCDRGFDEYVEPGILDKLNDMIEWDYCKFQGDRIEALEPGNCFAYDGSVFAIDRPDRIILVTGTGPLALRRFINDSVASEYHIFNEVDDTELDDLKYTVLDTPPDENEFDEICPVNYMTYRVWTDRFIDGRDIKTVPDYGLAIKVQVITTTGTDTTLIFRQHDVLYRGWEFEGELDYLHDLIEKAMKYMIYLNDPIRVMPKEEEKTEENEEEVS